MQTQNAILDDLVLARYQDLMELIVLGEHPEQGLDILRGQYQETSGMDLVIRIALTADPPTGATIVPVCEGVVYIPYAGYEDNGEPAYNLEGVTLIEYQNPESVKSDFVGLIGSLQCESLADWPQSS